MTKFLKKIVLVLLVLTAIKMKGQDKILLTNGKELTGELMNKTEDEFTFQSDNGKQYLLSKYRVFSYTKNGKEQVVYQYDSTSSEFLKVNEMRMFVYGERDALNTYKTPIVNSLGFAVGGASGYLMHSEQNLVYIPVPLVYSLFTLIFPTKVQQKKLSTDQYLREDEYLQGYERVARSKRTPNALKSSVIGMGVGFLVSLLVNGSPSN